ncbi:MAG: SMC-Scp complex subunit ScpB [Rhodobiaceae bacterium]|nr:SMC-Scp complex subunit ScpB [Rhodobiaceae bacterium]
MTDEQNTDIVEEIDAEATNELETVETSAEEEAVAGDGEEASSEQEAAMAEDADADNVTPFPTSDDHAAQLRMIEALLFAAAEPLDIDSIAARLPEGADVGALIEDLQKMYALRGVNLVRLANKWMFRTADDLTFLMEREAIQQRKLSRAAMETLAIIAYHQPVTRAEIEEIRGVSVSKGTLDVLMETGWVRLRGRRKVPGRPVTYGTTEEFMIHFGLENIGDLPGHEELRAAGLLEANLPPDFDVPTPSAEGGDGDGDFSEDEPEEEYGEALDEHLESAGEAEAAEKAG